MEEKKKMSYWKEFWYKRSENGELTYTPNTRKFWATISWVILCLWFIVVLVGIVYAILVKMFDKVPWSFILTMTGILIGNAQMAIGWYTLDKNNKRKYSNGILLKAEPIIEKIKTATGKIEETIEEV